jgi:hypothetical protein
MIGEPGRRLELPVKDQRIEVRAVGPDDGTQLLVDVYLGEEARVGQRLDTGPWSAPVGSTSHELPSLLRVAAHADARDRALHTEEARSQ